MTGSQLLLLAVALPLLASLVAPVAARVMGAKVGWLLASVFVPTLMLFTDVESVRSGTALEARVDWVSGIGLAFAFRADGFSLLFASIIAAVGLLIFVYAASYLGPGERHGRFFSYLLIFAGAMLGLVLADNLIALFAFWELTSISSFLLIGFWGARKASQDGALKALVITVLGGLALLVAVVLLILIGGDTRLSALDLAAIKASPLFVPLVVLLLIAAFTKSAQIPFYLWLPTAMEAPTPVSAYLHSATMVKAGIVLIAKMGFLFEVAPFSQVVLYVGLATMFWGAYLALRQNDLKALLAYSTISQLGLLTALYGAGHPFAATAHLINHAVFKAALFMAVGIIDHSAGSRDIGALSGLWRKLPFTTVLAVPAALSMAGLPPFGGFISKELFFEEMLHEGTLPTLIAVSGSIMTFAYSLRFLRVFFGRFRCENPGVHEASLPFLAPLIPLSVAVILFGLFPWDATIATWFTDLAAGSLGYEGESLYLWHGLGLGLALSVLTWFSGTALHLIRDHFVAMQTRLTPGWNANTVYYQLLAGLEHLALWLTNFTQGATFATHLRLIWGALALAGLGVASHAIFPRPGPVPLSMAIVGLLIVASVTGVLLARTRFSALIFMGLAGFGSTLVFVLLRAPDLALTQLLIEVVTVILFLSVFRFLPVLKRYSRPAPVALIDGIISLGVAFTVFVALVMVQVPLAPRIKDYFLAFSKELGGGYNVVNVILVDFRGYDTMGEITVLAIVAVTVLALIRLRFKRSQAGHEENRGER